MPHWLSITIAVVCWFFALQQLRMTLIYLGILPHPVIPQGSALAKIAIRSGIGFLLYGLVVFLIPWPRLLTCFCAAIVFLAVIDLILGMLGIGRYGSMAESRVNLKGNGIYLSSKILVFGIFAGLCVHYFGF